MPEVNSTEELMDIINDKRKEKNISSRQLSLHAGVSHATFFANRKGHRDPTISTVLKYLDVLNLKMRIGR